jgi:hypothetical protein
MMIRLPRVAAKLKTFAEIVTATHDRALEIRQDVSGATITATDGRQLCRIMAPPPEGMVPAKVQAFLVDARLFSKAAAEVGCSRTEAIVSSGPLHVAQQDRPLVVARIDDKTVGVAGPQGTPQTVAIAAGAMPDCARIIDMIRSEAAAGGTIAVARIDPRFLQSVADTAVAMGIVAVEITFAPHLNYLLAEGTGPDGCAAQFAIAGKGDIDFEAISSRPRPAWEADDAMTFTMPPLKPRSPQRRKPKPPDAPLFADDLPF